MICRKEQEADQLLTNQKPGLAADTVVIKLVYFIKPKCNRTLTTEVCKVT